MDKGKKKCLFLGIAAGIVCILVVGSVVFWKEKTVQTDEPGGTEVPTKEDGVQAEMTVYEDGTYPLDKAMELASNYSAVYQRLAEYYQTMYTLAGSTGTWENAETLPMADTTETYSKQSAIVFTDVSDFADKEESLYVQDGTYGYFVKADYSLAIIKLDQGLELQSIISDFQYEEEYIVDLYVGDGKLEVITNYTEAEVAESGIMSAKTMVYTYNVEDPKQPVQMGSIEIEGYYMGSRRLEYGVYVYTGCHKDGFISESGTLEKEQDLQAEDYVPSANGAVISADQIYMPEKVTENYYFTIGLVDPEIPNELKDVKTFLSADAEYCAGKESLFLILKNGLYNVSGTVLLRLAYTEYGVELVSAGAVSGGLINMGGMREMDGYLQVVSADHSGETNQNYMYVMDETFRIVLKQENLAQNVLIQSARFIEDKLYLATYAEKPIVVVDLTDLLDVKETAVEKPEGFEGLLCGFGENRILGVSYIVNSETKEYEGIRLTMFTVSGDEEIIVSHTADIQADTTPVASESSTLLLDKEQGLIGLSTEQWNEGYTQVENVYRVYHYEAETGFSDQLDAVLSQGNGWNSRGFVSGNVFYVNDQDAGVLKSYDRTQDYVQIGEVRY